MPGTTLDRGGGTSSSLEPNAGMQSHEVAALSAKARSFPYLPSGLDTKEVEDGLVHTGFWETHGNLGPRHTLAPADHRTMSPAYVAGNSLLYAKKFTPFGPQEFKVSPLTRAKSMQVLSNTTSPSCVTKGVGNFQFEDGAVYSGEFRDRSITGHGKYTWPGGRTYEGQYVRNKRDGEGTMKWATDRQKLGDRDEAGLPVDRRAYTGRWEDGKPADGTATWTSKRGTARSGTWSGGRRGWWIWPQEDPWGMHVHSTVRLPGHLTLRDAPK